MPKVSASTLAFLRKEEGLREKQGSRIFAYPDTKEVWTIGYGATWYPAANGTQIRVKRGDVISEQQAEALLQYHANYFAQGVLKKVGTNISQLQLDALTSFAFNFGLGGFNQSRVAAAVLKDSTNLAMIQGAFLSYENQKRRQREHDKYAQGTDLSGAALGAIGVLSALAATVYIFKKAKDNG